MKEIKIDQIFKEKDVEVTLGVLTFKIKVEKSSSSLLKQIHIKEDDIYEKKDIYLKEQLLKNEEVYKVLGKDPKRYPNSANALIKRIIKGKSLYQINNVVEINNYLSISYGLSFGCYDLSKIKGDIYLKQAGVNDTYKGIGKDELHLENLPILEDEAGIFGSPTSDSTKAMITLDTTSVLMLVYGLGKVDDMQKIMDTACDMLIKYGKAYDFEKKIFTN